MEVHPSRDPSNLRIGTASSGGPWRKSGRRLTPHRSHSSWYTLRTFRPSQRIRSYRLGWNHPGMRDTGSLLTPSWYHIRRHRVTSDEIEVIDDHITRPKDGRFGARTERNLVFRARDSLYQIRIRDDGDSPTSYALLARWSTRRDDWVIISSRKPAEMGISARGREFSEEIYRPIEDELIDVALAFEDSLHDIIESSK
jgi:hypothetical protein